MEVSAKRNSEVEVATNLLKEFHVLATHPSLAEFEETMSRCGVVKDDAEDFWTEEVG